MLRLREKLPYDTLAAPFETEESEEDLQEYDVNTSNLSSSMISCVRLFLETTDELEIAEISELSKLSKIWILT